MSRKPKNINKETFIKLYYEGKSDVKISKEMNIPVRTLQHYAAKLRTEGEIEYRSKSEVIQKKTKKNPKILIFDIENSPNSAYIWSLFQEVTSADFIDSPWYMLCFCAKWLGEDKIISSSLVDFPKEYKKNPENDKLVLKELWDLLDKADICIGHNLRGFDVRKANARFIMNGMTPPSPYKIIDTLLVARRSFMFTSNKLNDLSVYLGLGKKLDTGGFKLWKQCMAGDKEAWKKMVKYCKQDIVLTEKVYKKVLPYMEHHPNLTVYTDTETTEACPKCQSTNIIKNGFAYTNVYKYQQYSCKNCGGWHRSRKSIKRDK